MYVSLLKENQFAVSAVSFYIFMSSSTFSSILGMVNNCNSSHYNGM